MTNATWVFDFTWNFDPKNFEKNRSLLKEFLQTTTKNWGFQYEIGKSGNHHFQGRVRLQQKKRLENMYGLCHPSIHWSVTSKSNSIKECFYNYVTKDTTREAGPWTDKDKIEARQFREFPTLLPWQQQVIDSVDVWDTRSVNLIYDQEGNIGKSILVGKMHFMGKGKKLPFCNDYKDIMRMAYDVSRVEVPKCFLIDLPRAIRKDKLYQMFAAIEELKSGYCFDDRYEFKDDYIDSPVIWVFTNKQPDISLLSRDRWKIWEVEDDNLKALAL